MTEGLSLIVRQDLSIFFMECDTDCHGGGTKHPEILKRLGWQENEDPDKRNFVRVEVPYWDMEYFKFDEIGNLPPWVTWREDDIRNKVAKLMERMEVVHKIVMEQGICKKSRELMIEAIKDIPGYVPA